MDLLSKNTTRHSGPTRAIGEDKISSAYSCDNGTLCKQLDRDIQAPPVHLGGLCLGNPSREVSREYASSVKVTTPLVEHSTSQTYPLPDESLVKSAQQAAKSERVEELKDMGLGREHHQKPDSRERVIGVADSASPPMNGLQPEQTEVS